ncbi:MAG TPA: CRTAC1 family protein [Planctomycetaceae bacterium]|nr:CRTAC1 family protein [Planctomycetaceae bacterium]
MTPVAWQRLPLLLWTLLLAASLAAVVALNRSGVAGSGADSGPADAMARFGFELEEAAARSGVDFVHQGPTFDRRLDHIMPQVGSMGAAVAVADFDRDGLQDFYVTNSGEGSLNRLYRNGGDGTFRDVAAAMGLADVNQAGTGVSMGAVWGDYDNDGYEDLFLYKYGRPELFHNDGGRGFSPVGERAGLPPWVNANSAVWLDYDGDGWLDLFLAGYWPETVNLWSLNTTRIMPESFEYAQNGGRKYLFRNRGDGTFEEIAAKVGIDSRRWTLAVAAGHLLGTGYPDLFLANDYGVSELYANRDGKQFVDVGRETGVGRTPKSGMNAAFGDVFNDGRLSIYKTNISEPGVLVQGNDLWVPKQAGGATLEYDNLATSLGVDLGGWSWGAQFGDLNNDGTLDIYLVNGYISAGDRTSYWYDFAEIAVGHSAIIADALNWPPMRGRSLSGYQRTRLWLNDGLGRFTEVAQVVGATDGYDGRAVALADLSNGGVLDVIVANQRGPLLLYKNKGRPGRHWIAFDLEGSASNRSAIGARVELQWNGRLQVQEVSGGSGFSAQNQRRLHYGLGDAARVDRVVIRWPSGRRQTVESPQVDTLHRITEPR